MKKQKVAKKIIAGTVLTVSFSNQKELKIDLLNLTPEMREQLALHGLAQKVGDAYASSEGNPDHAYAMASAVIENLLAGQWASREKGGMVYQAIAEITGIRPPACSAFRPGCSRAKSRARQGGDRPPNAPRRLRARTLFRAPMPRNGP